MAGIEALLAFAESARERSFAVAARKLGLSPSAVAKSVARLEADLGLRLFHRTTRQVSPTSDGHALYERCRRVVDEIEALRTEAEGMRGLPSGTLRLDMPVTIGKTTLLPRLAALGRRHPGLGFDLSFSDRYVDVVKEGFDAVVRIGRLSDSSLVARRIGAQELVVIGSLRYLGERGTPQEPADLKAHDCIVFRNPTSGRRRPWQFRNGRRAIEIEPESRLQMNDGEAIVAAVAAGMGLAQVPDYMAGAALRTGQVVELLARWRPAPLPISLVFASSRLLTPRLRVLIDAFAEAPVTEPLPASGLSAAVPSGARARPAPRRKDRGRPGGAPRRDRR
jgi:DNA-binding transcriptional LysR family regulator